MYLNGQNSEEATYRPLSSPVTDVRVDRFGLFSAALVMVTSLVLFSFQGAWASVNIPLHHWAYEAIERLTALGIIDQAMVVAKPYSRKQAAKYVARAIERIRADEIRADGREALAEPLLERLMAEFRPELMDLGTIA